MLIRAMIIGATLCVALCGCSREVASEPVNPGRANDPAYRAVLKQQAEAREDILRRASEVKREYDEAVASDPEGETAKALKAKLDELDNEFLTNREESIKIVRDRIHRELKERREAREEKAK